MASKPKLSPQDVLTARAMLKRGMSRTEVANRFGVSRRALGFALEREAAASADPEIPTGAKPASQDPDPADDPADRDRTTEELGLPDDVSLSELDEQIALCKRLQRVAEDEGNLAEVRQQGMVLRHYLALRDRISARSGADAIVIPLAEYEATLASARSKFEQMASAAPMLCAHCRRELAVSWAQDPLAPAAGEEGEE